MAARRPSIAVLLLVAAAACRTAASVPPAAQAADPCAASGVASGDLIAENHRIPSDTPGVELLVRSKRLASGDLTSRGSVLYVHGSGYPSEATFDLRLGGFSWMDYLACRGWDAWFVDVRGYGGSTRPPEMDEPPEANRPVATTEVAIRDLGMAVDYVRSKRGVASVALIGWSWGTTLAGGLAASAPAKVSRLVLYGPIWTPRSPEPPPSEPIASYSLRTREVLASTWMEGVPEGRRGDLIPAGWFEEIVAAWAASDPKGLLRRPNGWLVEYRQVWLAGKATYDPSAIRAPTLLAVGEWDGLTPLGPAQDLFARLATPRKRLVVVGEGSHQLMMERNRLQLIREVQLFLDEAPAP